MFYEQFVRLCKERGMSPAAVTREIGLNNSSSTAWKHGSVPKGETLQKLADYFGVSVDYLLGKEGEPFEVGDSLLGDKLIVTSVQNNGNGTFSVSFRADPEGIDVEALKKLMNFMIEKGISTDGLFELVEVAEKLTRRREDVSQTHTPTPDTPRKETPTEDA